MMLLWLLLPRLLLLPRGRLVVVMVLLLQLLPRLLLLHVVGGKLVAGELVKDRAAAAGVLVSGCCCYCGCFCSGCCQCRGGGWW